MKYEGVAKEVLDGKTLIDLRWESFSSEELQIISDGIDNYDSGISAKSVQELYRSLLTELFSRAN